MQISSWDNEALSAGEEEDSDSAMNTETAELPENAQLLKVSARSQPSLLAGAIAGVIRAGEVAQLQAIGAGAVNQAVKAVATARGYLGPEGIDIMCVPAFVQVDLEGVQRTAISIRVERI